MVICKKRYGLKQKRDLSSDRSLLVVGVTRLELVASWTRTMHATKLRYTPTSPLATQVAFASTFVIIAQMVDFVNPFLKFFLKRLFDCVIAKNNSIGKPCRRADKQPLFEPSKPAVVDLKLRDGAEIVERRVDKAA